MDIDQIIQASKASQDKQELRFLYDSVSQIEPKVILEIGTWKGFSMETFHQLFHPELFITIENNKEILQELFYKTADGLYNWMDPSPILIQGDSAAASTVAMVNTGLAGRTIDFLFIDGDHRYEAVRKDFELYLPMMSDHGIIGFHDVALEGRNADGHLWSDIGLEVKRFWDELQQRYVCKEMRGSGLATGTGLLFLGHER